MMNKVFLVGRLTKAPEARTTTSGIHVTTFTLAVTRKANRDEADYINIVTWRGLADNCMSYLVQGQQAAVIGEIQTRSYQGTDGKNRYITEVIADEVEFLAKPQAQQRQHPANDPNMFNHQQTMFQGPVTEELNEVMDEDLPF